MTFGFFTVPCSIRVPSACLNRRFAIELNACRNLHRDAVAVSRGAGLFRASSHRKRARREWRIEWRPRFKNGGPSPRERQVSRVRAGNPAIRPGPPGGNGLAEPAGIASERDFRARSWPKQIDYEPIQGVCRPRPKRCSSLKPLTNRTKGTERGTASIGRRPNRPPLTRRFLYITHYETYGALRRRS